MIQSNHEKHQAPATVHDSSCLSLCFFAIGASGSRYKFFLGISNTSFYQRKLRSLRSVGYLVYSAIALEGSLVAPLGSRFAMEFSFRPESREIDRRDAGAIEATRLGSVEMLSLNWLLQYRFSSSGWFRPYVGLGVSYGVFWEKSGALDNNVLTPSLGPVVQLGTNINLSSLAYISLDAKSGRLRTDIKTGAQKVATLRIDPLVLGFGIGFRF